MPPVPITPKFENPYPQVNWLKIEGFAYETPLRLHRGVDTVKMCGGHADAEFVIADDFTVSYRLDGKPQSLTVPRGMLTDLASLPPAAHALVGRLGPHLEATIVHDFLYIAWQGIPDYPPRNQDKIFADKLFRAALRAAGVEDIHVALVYAAAREFGWPIYQAVNLPPRYIQI